MRHPSLTAEVVCAGSWWRGAGLLGTNGLGAGNQLPFPFSLPLLGSWEYTAELPDLMRAPGRGLSHPVPLLLGVLRAQVGVRGGVAAGLDSILVSSS